VDVNPSTSQNGWVYGTFLHPKWMTSQKAEKGACTFLTKSSRRAAELAEDAEEEKKIYHKPHELTNGRKILYNKFVRFVIKILKYRKWRLVPFLIFLIIST